MKQKIQFITIQYKVEKTSFLEILAYSVSLIISVIAVPIIASILMFAKI